MKKFILLSLLFATLFVFQSNIASATYLDVLVYYNAGGVATNATVQLMVYDGTNWITISTADNYGDGNYAFANDIVPGLYYQLLINGVPACPVEISGGETQHIDCGI